MYRKAVGSLIISAFILAVMVGMYMTLQAKAQDSGSKLSLLIKQLHEEGKEILFQFAIPLVADENVWVLPDNLENDHDQLSRLISEVGEDYICFDELAGQAYSKRCTPFSNIVSISYLNQPA